MRISAAHHSDRGDRENNEDWASAADDGRLLLVADGMGGQRGGEVASRLSTEAALDGLSLLLSCDDDQAILEQLQQIFQEANRRLLNAAQRDIALLGLGTTLTLAFIRDQQLYLAHVGDSRLYLYRNNQCQQLSRDHTRAREFVESGVLSEEQAQRSSQRNTLTRYIGTAHRIDPQLEVHSLEPDDRLLLCSDGLYDVLDLDTIAVCLGSGDQPETLAKALVQKALQSGRPDLDNSTALVAIVKQI